VARARPLRPRVACGADGRGWVQNRSQEGCRVGATKSPAPQRGRRPVLGYPERGLSPLWERNKAAAPGLVVTRRCRPAPSLHREPARLLHRRQQLLVQLLVGLVRRDVDAVEAEDRGTESARGWPVTPTVSRTVFQSTHRKTGAPGPRPRPIHPGAAPLSRAPGRPDPLTRCGPWGGCQGWRRSGGW
jgi:hypothetical protein